MTKLLWNPQSMRIIGAGVVGLKAGEPLAEMVLAMEMSADMNGAIDSVYQARVPLS